MDDLERQLAWEGAERAKTGASAIAAGLLLVIGAIYGTLVVLAGLPTVGLVQGLAPARGGQKEAAVDPHSARIFFIDHHAAGLILAAVLVAAATLAMIPVLRYLYSATGFRLQRAFEAATAPASATNGGALAPRTRGVP